jgi:mRNA interferase HicA
MNANELRRYIRKRDRRARFVTHKSGSGHITVIIGDRRSQIPMHGRNKELGKGLVKKILKDLGLDD